MADEKIKINILPKWLIIILAIFLIMLFICAFLYFILSTIYENKIYPNIYIGEQNIGGLSQEQAKKLLNEKVDYIEQNGVPFIYGDKQANIQPLIASTEGDLAYQIINFEVDKTVSYAFAYGRTKNFIINIDQRIKSLFVSQNQAMQFTLNAGEIQNVLSSDFGGYEMPARDAKLIYATNTNNKDITFKIEAEKYGNLINYQDGINELSNNLKVLDSSAITLNEQNNSPKILKKDCANIENKAKQILDSTPITLIKDQDKYIIGPNDLAGLLTLKKNPDETSEDLVLVEINNKALENYLNTVLGPKINKEPAQAKFEMKNGKVQAFQAGGDGLNLDVSASALKIKNTITSRGTSTDLVVNIVKSEDLASSTNNFGIKEIIGTGQSNFKGSPKNRRHNIKTGADTLNGILIKPDEEFSLVKTLGEIDASSGYLTELVIKGNKTTPEYGGGLCQIGTTMFRGALASGLPITMRRNHSYRVSYYEPAGTDATIYSPLPDLRFKNDTGNYILIQSRINGDILYFDFWGVNDGRITVKTEPKIYNIVKPGPVKTIETLDLKPGEKKCIETAHNGADAYFDYKVTYADGKIAEKRFSSHYIPWRAVCLLGVDKLTTEIDKNSASTTPTEKIP
jgi:vancomycin resistance protein YoaR